MEPVEDSQSSHIFICLLFFLFFAVKSAGVWWKSVGRTPFLPWRAGQVCVGAPEKLMLMAASSMPPSARRCFPSKNPTVCSSEDLEKHGKTWKNMENTCNNCLWVLFCTCQSVTWMVPALGGGYSCDLNLLDLSCGPAERRENPISILRNLCHRRVMGGPSADFPHFDSFCILISREPL